MLARSWRKLCAAEASCFVVMQWNVLSDELCTTSSFPYTNPASLEWENRQKTLLDEIRRVSPSVLALEEVDRYEDYYLPFLKEEYDSVFFQKAGGKDGTVLAWKKDEFSRSADSYCLRYSQTGSQGAIIQSLTHMATEKKILVAGTHLVSLFHCKCLANTLHRKPRKVLKTFD